MTDPNEPVDVVEEWTLTGYKIIIDGVVVASRKHYYPFSPVIKTGREFLDDDHTSCS